MRSIILLLASVMLVVLLVSGIAGAQTEGAVLDAHAELDTEAVNNTDTSIQDPVMQTFVAEHTGFVTEVTALIAVGPPDTSITAQIVKVPDSLQGQPEILAETQTTAPELSTWKKGTKLFSFDDPAQLDPHGGCRQLAEALRVLGSLNSRAIGRGGALPVPLFHYPSRPQ
jgi:hypothetical protein